MARKPKQFADLSKLFPVTVDRETARLALLDFIRDEAGGSIGEANLDELAEACVDRVMDEHDASGSFSEDGLTVLRQYAALYLCMYKAMVDRIVASVRPHLDQAATDAALAAMRRADREITESALIGERNLAAIRIVDAFHAACEETRKTKASIQGEDAQRYEELMRLEFVRNIFPAWEHDAMALRETWKAIIDRFALNQRLHKIDAKDVADEFAPPFREHVGPVCERVREFFDKPKRRSPRELAVWHAALAWELTAAGSLSNAVKIFDDTETYLKRPERKPAPYTTPDDVEVERRGDQFTIWTIRGNSRSGVTVRRTHT